MSCCRVARHASALVLLSWGLGAADPWHSLPPPAPAEDALEERLERIERQLDLLLEAPAPPTPRPKPPRRRLSPAPRPTPRGAPPAVQAPAPRAAPAADPNPVAPAPAPRRWTWEEVDRWRHWKTLTRGD
jgi:hypothetical protein